MTAMDTLVTVRAADRQVSHLIAIDMKYWEKVGCGDTLIGWIRGMRDRIYERFPFPRRECELAVVHIINDLNPNDEDDLCERLLDISHEYPRTRGAAQNFFSDYAQSQPITYFFITDQEKAVYHPFWVEIYKHDMIKAAHLLRYYAGKWDGPEDDRDSVDSMEEIFDGLPVECLSVDPVPHISKEGVEPLSVLGHASINEHAVKADNAQKQIGGKSTMSMNKDPEKFLSFLERAAGIYERI